MPRIDLKDVLMPLIEALKHVVRPQRVSVDFPDEARYVPENFRGVLVNEHVRCIGCRQCAKVCPANAIELYYEPEGVYKPGIDYGRCIFCGLCVEVCPTGSLTHLRYQEIVTDNVDKLRICATYLTPDKVLPLVNDRRKQREVSYRITPSGDVRKIVVKDRR